MLGAHRIGVKYSQALEVSIFGAGTHRRPMDIRAAVVRYLGAERRTLTHCEFLFQQ